MENYSTVRKREILPSVTIWMDLEGLMLREISQRKTCHMISLNIWNLIDRYREQTVAERFGGSRIDKIGGEDQEIKTFS